MKRCPCELLLAFALLAPGALAAPAPSLTGPDRQLDARARTVLRQVVDGPQTWEQMHALEALIACGEGSHVHDVLLGKWAPAARAPFRNSVWRFLAMSSPTAGERVLWTEKIKRVLLDPAAPDQGQAVEVLAKLHYRLHGPGLEIVRRMAAGPDGPNTYYCLWALQLAGGSDVRDRLVRGLSSTKPEERKGAAGVLRLMGSADAGALVALAQAADQEPAASMAYPGVLSSAVTLEPNHAHAAAWQAKLDRHFFTGLPRERLDAGYGLMTVYQLADLPRLAPLLEDKHDDTRTIAAWTILKVEARASSPPGFSSPPPSSAP